MKKRKLIDFEEELMELLKDQNEALGYLKEAMQDDDDRVFLLAIEDIFNAYSISIFDYKIK